MNTKAVVVPLKSTVVREQQQPQTLAEQIKAKMASTFSGIFRNAAETSPYSPGGKLPMYGPYGLAILYKEDGSPHHLVSVYIDRLRFQRPFTKNAIELRCDALGLAIYVSGNPELAENGSMVKTTVRLVVYLKDGLKPHFQKTAASADELVDKLHGILVDTYNHLAREHNLAGFPASWLTLKCATGAIPEIPLVMNMQAKG